MPLKLIPPHKTPGGTCFAVHGSYLGVSVRRSARTDRRQVAQAVLKSIEREIEQGRFADGPPPKVSGFADAALGYLKDCGTSEVGYVKALLEHFRDTPLAQFTRDLIDEGEEALYPGRRDTFAAGTLNRQYRAPLAAVLHHASKRGLCAWVKVEKYAEEQRTAWLEPEQAARLIAAARTVDAAKTKHNFARLAPLLVFAFGTGARLSESLNLTWADVDLAAAHAILRDTKNGKTYGIHLAPVVVAELANVPGTRLDGSREPQRRVFGYTHRRSMRWSLEQACTAANLTDFTMHQARHSFATWLRRSGADLKKLMELGRWEDARSALRYQHVASHEQIAALANLPLTAAGITAGAVDLPARARAWETHKAKKASARK
jgi:integrase